MCGEKCRVIYQIRLQLLGEIAQLFLFFYFKWYLTCGTVIMAVCLEIGRLSCAHRTFLPKRLYAIIIPVVGVGGVHCVIVVAITALAHAVVGVAVHAASVHVVVVVVIVLLLVDDDTTFSSSFSSFTYPLP